MVVIIKSDRRYSTLRWSLKSLVKLIPWFRRCWYIWDSVIIDRRIFLVLMELVQAIWSVCYYFFEFMLLMLHLTSVWFLRWVLFDLLLFALVVVLDGLKSFEYFDLSRSNSTMNSCLFCAQFTWSCFCTKWLVDWLRAHSIVSCYTLRWVKLSCEHCTWILPP